MIYDLRNRKREVVKRSFIFTFGSCLQKLDERLRVQNVSTVLNGRLSKN